MSTEYDESKLYKVTAYLIGYKKEADKDFHIVLSQTPNPEIGDGTGQKNQSMIVEMPDPECQGAAGTRYTETFKNVRSGFNQLLAQDGDERLPPPGGKFHELKKPFLVDVVGVAFFDPIHGQTGVAPNGIELHPVLSFAAAK